MSTQNVAAEGKKSRTQSKVNKQLIDIHSA